MNNNEINKDVLDKIKLKKQIEENERRKANELEEYYNNCYCYDICPKCGRDLKNKTERHMYFKHEYSPAYYFFNCKRCGFKYSDDYETDFDTILATLKESVDGN